YRRASDPACDTKPGRGRGYAIIKESGLKADEKGGEEHMFDELIARDRAVNWHPYSQMKTSQHIPIVSGKGAYLYAADGKAYLDAVSSWWVTIHGHAHPYIAERVYQQLLSLEQVIFAGFTHEPAIE